MQEFFNFADKNPIAFVVAGAGVVVIFVIHKLFEFAKPREQSGDNSTEVLKSLSEITKVMLETAAAKRAYLDAISNRLDYLDAKLDKIREDLWQIKN